MTGEATGIPKIDWQSTWVRTTAVVGVVLVLSISIICTLTGHAFVPSPAPYKPGQGVEYAVSLADASGRLSLGMMIAGWFCVILGSFSAMAASLVNTKSADGDETFIGTVARHRGLLAGATAVVLGGVGWQLLDRSAAASRMASAATTAIAQTSDKDYEAYLTCVKAKAVWLEGRMNQERLADIVNGLAAAQNPTEPDPTEPNPTAPNPTAPNPESPNPESPNPESPNPESPNPGQS